jgi:hypothetical protein
MDRNGYEPSDAARSVAATKPPPQERSQRRAGRALVGVDGGEVARVVVHGAGAAPGADQVDSSPEEVGLKMEAIETAAPPGSVRFVDELQYHPEGGCTRDQGVHDRTVDSGWRSVA